MAWCEFRIGCLETIRERSHVHHRPAVAARAARRPPRQRLGEGVRSASDLFTARRP